MADLQDIRDSVAFYLHRTDLSDDDLDLFINFGQDRINRALRPTITEVTEALTVSATSGVYGIPDTYGTMRAVYQFKGDVTIELKPLSALEAAKWDRGAEAALGYIVTGITIKTYPAINSGITVVFWSEIEALVTGTQINLYTQFYDRLLTYAALVEGATWERDPGALTMFQTLYQSELTEAKVQAEKSRYGAGPVAASHYQAPTGIQRSM